GTASQKATSPQIKTFPMPVLALPKPVQRSADPGLRIAHGLGGLVAEPRPEEAAQAVLLAPGHDVDVEVRHALADAVVDGHEAAVRLHPVLHRRGQRAGPQEERTDARGREVAERLVMLLGHEQAMAGEDGAVIEERDALLVVEDDVAVPAGHDGAERAARL